MFPPCPPRHGFQLSGARPDAVDRGNWFAPELLAEARRRKQFGVELFFSARRGRQFGVELFFYISVGALAPRMYIRMYIRLRALRRRTVFLHPCPQ